MALVYQKLASSSLLDTYHEERLPVIAEVLKKTTTLLDKTFEAKLKTAESGFSRSRSLLQLGVNYRWSSIVVEEELHGQQTATAGGGSEEDIDHPLIDPYNPKGDGKLHTGDRAPDAPGLVNVTTNESTSLFRIFGYTYHTVLLLDDFDSDAGDSALHESKFTSVLEAL